MSIWEGGALKMMRAMDVARWFVAWAENIDAEVSNLKLQKLLYYAQGHHMAVNGTPLFSDDLQAWAHGPVVPSVYHAYKKYNRGPIDPDEALGDDFDWGDFRDIENFLIDIWDRYGALAAWALRERTHREAPWRDAFNEDTRGTVITKDSILEYFIAPNSAAGDGR
ncbi:Panacea domain-containing protein [Mycobacteroides abscessus]|nr:type II toxin-antitoxin system antitoxin SocA domain-containing protein [Mycobacteroides abscessus]MDO3348699.1 DUF4065 domain-containing protein [Mycobacteroides abscessus subsp. abscessus]